MPSFGPTPEYLLFLLSVIITTLGLITVGGLLRGVFRSRYRARFRKKLLFFPVFVIGLFAIGWLSERLQQWLFAYLKQNVATSLSGLFIAILIAWLLYDWVFWRR